MMNSSALLGQSAAPPPFSSLDLGLGPGPLAPGPPAGPGGSETELQKMLIDERMRCENHKTNYQTLKAEHTRLQDEFSRVQGDLQGLLGARQLQQEKLQLLLAEVRGEILDKTRQLEECRLQVMTPQRLDVLRAQLQQEMEAPVRERFNKLEEEAELYRSNYNKLRYDYTLLKSQSDHHAQETARLLEERGLHFEAELSRLEREKEALAAQYRSSDPGRDARRVEALLRDKAQLHLRLKGLQAEVTELRARSDDSGQQAESLQRSQLRQLADAQAALKALEAERQSARLQVDRVEAELRLTHEQNSQLTGRLHKAEREVNALTGQVESIRHAHKLDMANVRLESTRCRAEVERERDALQDALEALQTDVEVLRAGAQRQKEALVEKEREAVRRVQAAREEEIHKMAALHEEKLEAESRVAELEQQRALWDTAGHAHREEWEERLRGAQLGEESARKELQGLRARMQQQSSRLEELERRSADMEELQQQHQELAARHAARDHAEERLRLDHQLLQEEQEVLRAELRTARCQAERSQQDGERLLEERSVRWLEEKHLLQENGEQLRHKYGQAKERLQRAASAQKKRRAQTESREQRLQQRIQLLEAKTEHLELERRAADSRPPSEEHAHLNRRLRELQRRHGEFRHLLLGRHAPPATGSSSFPPSSLLPPVPPGHSPPAETSVQAFDSEVSQLRRRLEELENVQLHQMDQLGVGGLDPDP